MLTCEGVEYSISLYINICFTYYYTIQYNKVLIFLRFNSLQYPNDNRKINNLKE